MNTDNVDNDTKNCPYCAEQIKLAAIKCKHCGEFLVEEKAPSIIEIGDSKTPVQGESNTILIVLFLGAALLHVLFCAESPLVSFSASDPISSLVYSIGYSIPGMVISIIFLVPILNYVTKNKLEEGLFTLKSVTIALYIGAAIRLFLFINKFMV